MTQSREEQQQELIARIKTLSDESVLRLFNATSDYLAGDEHALSRLAEQVEQETRELEALHSGGEA